MKQNIFSVVFFSVFFHGMCAAQLTYDTLYSAPVGPGVIYTRLYEPTTPFNVSVLEVELKNPYLKMETVKGGDLLTGFEWVSSMSARNNYDGHYVVGAINGDLYGSVPTNVQVEKGEMLLRTTGKSRIGFDASNHVSLSIVSYSGTLAAGDSSYAIGGINESRGANALILYNSYKGSSTGTNQYGTEAAVHPITRWLVNDAVACIVDSVVQGVGNMTIAKGGAVLSGNGTASDFLTNNVHAGDTVKVALSLSPSLKDLTEMIGGYPRIVSNGTNDVAGGVAQEGGPDPYHPNPRTGVGFSADSSKLYLITLDGRNSPLTLGMTLDQFADLMIQLGVYNGMNFDGGGSSTMVVHNSVVNYIAGERAVSNGLMIVADVSSDSVVHSIRILPPNQSKNFTVYKMVRIFTGDSTTWEVSGYDQYYNPLPIDASKLKLSVDPVLGRINPAGYFVAGAQHDSGYVYATYNGSIVDSEFVVVKTLSTISISPSSVVTDTARPVSFSAEGFDTDNMQQSLDQQYLQWSSSNTAVGGIDASGTFQGKSEGSVYIIASYEGLKDSVMVTVKVNKGFLVIDSLESLNAWNIGFLNVDTANTKVTVSDNVSSLGSESFRIDYKFTFTGSPDFVYFNRNIPLSGVPDSLWIDLKADRLTHIVYYVVTDATGRQYTLSSAIAKDSTKLAPLQARVSSYSSAMIFPVTLDQVGVLLGGGTRRYNDSTYTGTIYLDNLRVSYPARVTEVREINSLPSSFTLFQNYPNPFNPATHLRFTIADVRFVTLKVYDVLGREVATLVNEQKSPGTYEVQFDGSRLSSGVYFYRLTAGNFVDTKKFVLMK
ncbi:MAG: phosphodiester glycosidase family protein [Bacteroidota bacterium]|nr:phosphodiester glycosidase family protein [Bacteroidota bacterium]